MEPKGRPDTSSRSATGGTGFLYDAKFKDHRTGAGHPERPARLDAIIAALTESDLIPRLTKLQPRACSRQELLACHTEDYLSIVERDVERGAGELSTGDTVICEDSLEVARLAAGGVCVAVDAVCDRTVRNAFCAVRPPGHHATPSGGMGFCLFNNIAVATRYAQSRHGLGNVLIIDWDVHHGNGTQDVFYGDPTVLFFSTHQSPWYPGTGSAEETGSGAARGTTINVPLPAGSGRKEVVGAFAERLLPAANQFKPDLVMVSAGFDSRLGDPLGHFTLTDDDFAELTTIAMSIADDHADGRVVSVLEGGYSLEGVGKGAVAHVAALLKRD